MHTILIGVQEEQIESTANKLDGQCTVIETRHLWVKSIQGNMVLLAMPYQITLPGY